MFVSYKFGSRIVKPKDIRPSVCFEKQARLCTGILLFDILVANSDRWESNLKVDNPDDPTEIEVFDHERALFGFLAGDGARRLETLKDHLGVGGGPLTGGTRHCFLSVANTSDHFSHWIERIAAISPFLIEDVCAEAPSINQNERDVAIKFLVERRRDISLIIAKHKETLASKETVSGCSILVERLNGFGSAGLLRITEHVQGDAVVDMRLSTNGIDRLLHLAVATIAAFDRVGGRGK